MKVRNLTTLISSAALALVMMTTTAERAEARHGWGWGGVGAGIAAAVILGSIYHHRHHRYYATRTAITANRTTGTATIARTATSIR